MNPTSFKVENSAFCGVGLQTGCWHDCTISFKKKTLTLRLNGEQIWSIMVALENKGIRQRDMTTDDHFWSQPSHSCFKDYAVEGQKLLNMISAIKAKKGRTYAFEGLYISEKGLS